MTDPNDAQSAATCTAASRLHRLLGVVVPTLLGVTLSSLSFAAPLPSHKDHAPTKAHATSQRPSAPATTTKATTAKAKSKPAVAQRPTQPRKAPTKARVAAKSKRPTRGQQPARKPAKLAAKQTKHAA